MKIEVFDPFNIDLIRKECDEALKNVLDKYSLTHTLGQGIYNNRYYKLKFTIKTKKSSDIVLTVRKGVAIKLGDIVDKEINVSGKIFKIIDWDKKRLKRPIITRGKDNEIYIFSEKVLDQVLNF